MNVSTNYSTAKRVDHFLYSRPTAYKMRVQQRARSLKYVSIDRSSTAIDAMQLLVSCRVSSKPRATPPSPGGYARLNRASRRRGRCAQTSGTSSAKRQRTSNDVRTRTKMNMIIPPLRRTRNIIESNLHCSMQRAYVCAIRARTRATRQIEHDYSYDDDDDEHVASVSFTEHRPSGASSPACAHVRFNCTKLHINVPNAT